MGICYKKHLDFDSAIKFLSESLKFDEKYIRPLMIRA